MGARKRSIRAFPTIPTRPSPWDGTTSPALTFSKRQALSQRRGGCRLGGMVQPLLPHLCSSSTSYATCCVLMVSTPQALTYRERCSSKAGVSCTSKNMGVTGKGALASEDKSSVDTTEPGRLAVEPQAQDHCIWPHSACLTASSQACEAIVLLAKDTGRIQGNRRWELEGGSHLPSGCLELFLPGCEAPSLLLGQLAPEESSPGTSFRPHCSSRRRTGFGGCPWPPTSNSIF